MPKRLLTDSFVKSATCSPEKVQEDYRDTASKGLALRVSRAGAKGWSFLYTFNKRRRRHSLGEYGRKTNEGELTLSQARDAAAGCRVMLANGTDPAAEVDALKASQTSATLADVLNQHLARLERQGRRANYLNNIRDQFKAHVLPKLGDRIFSTITTADIERCLRPIEAAGHAASYNKLVTIMPPLWKLAKLPDPITGEFDRMQENESPEPFTLDELAIIWRALDDPAAKVTPIVACAIRLSALTMKRGIECAEALISQLDMKSKTWTVPPFTMKGARAETVPLSAEALKTIETALMPINRPAENDGGKLFPSPRVSGECIKQNSMSRAFVRARRVAGIEDDGRTLHGLRHTGATALAASGIPIHVVSALLSHKNAGGGPRVSQRYNQYDLINERRAALDTLGRWIDEAVTGEAYSKNILPMRDAV